MISVMNLGFNMSAEDIARDIFGITEADLLPGETLIDARERVQKQTEKALDDLERVLEGQTKTEE